MHRNSNKLVKLLQQLQLTIALGESMTCGLAAHQLATVKGTMDMLRGSVVCYHPDTKTEVLNIPQTLIKKYTAESIQVTKAFAKNLRQLFKADIYAAVTGLAAHSANGSEDKNKPVGTVFIVVIYKNKIHPFKKCFRGTPGTVRMKACNEIYKAILDILGKS